MEARISIDDIKVIWVLVAHYAAVGILGYTAFLMIQSSEVLWFAAVAVGFLTLLVLAKAAGESLEALGVITPTKSD